MKSHEDRLQELFCEHKEAHRVGGPAVSTWEVIRRKREATKAILKEIFNPKID
ncbi:hypothetical protein [Herbaspirillum seropedicae]|uniref:hypothetical protein n=1 Tax=Herbaspirillum seropedicae TaxID=964 RepID=UPI003FCC3D78